MNNFREFHGRPFSQIAQARPEETRGTEASPGRRGLQMHCEDLLGRDLLSEIVLVGFGALILVFLLLFFVATLARA